LNAIWAITIVALEVPSGALADLIGRKRLVVGAAVIMVMEMSLLLLAPMNGGWLLFLVCAVNRCLAGVAEAAASGADEALAYDSLQGEQREQQWDEVLSVLGRRYAVCMALAMVIGALVYDPITYQWLSDLLGASVVAPHITIKLPVFLCLIQGIIALAIALRLTDQIRQSERDVRVSALVVQTLKAIKWVWMTRLALVLISGVMIVDAITRNYATLTSSYYRYVNLPEFSFGLLGAGISLCSFVVPYYAKPLARRFSLLPNIMIVACIAGGGLIGIALFDTVWGVLFSILIMMSLYHVGFISSRFLNELSPSKMRATVLSVKSLMCNLGYASFSILFAQTLAYRSSVVDQNEAFHEVLLYTPIFLFFIMLVFLMFVVLRSANGVDGT